MTFYVVTMLGVPSAAARIMELKRSVELVTTFFQNAIGGMLQRWHCRSVDGISIEILDGYNILI